MYMCKVLLHYRLFFKFLTSVVILWQLLYICIAGRRRFTEMQNPRDAKMLNVYLARVRVHHQYGTLQSYADRAMCLLSDRQIIDWSWRLSFLQLLFVFSFFYESPGSQWGIKLQFVPRVDLQFLTVGKIGVHLLRQGCKQLQNVGLLVGVTGSQCKGI